MPPLEKVLSGAALIVAVGIIFAMMWAGPPKNSAPARNDTVEVQVTTMPYQPVYDGQTINVYLD